MSANSGSQQSRHLIGAYFHLFKVALHLAELCHGEWVFRCHRATSLSPAGLPRQSVVYPIPRSPSARTQYCSGADTKKGKAGRLSGNVRTQSDDKTEVTLRKGTVDRVVIFRSVTKFNLQASGGAKPTPGSIDDVSESKYMACTGTWEGAKLAATACTISSATQH